LVLESQGFGGNAPAQKGIRNFGLCPADDMREI